MSNEIDKILSDFQLYKRYVQVNFPYKQTNYKGETDPSIVGHPGAVGDTYSQIVNSTLQAQFRKLGSGNTDWQSLDASYSIPTRTLIEISDDTGTIPIGDFTSYLNQDVYGTDYIWSGDSTLAELYATPHSGQLVTLYFPVNSTYPKTINLLGNKTLYGTLNEVSLTIPEGGYVFTLEFSSSLDKWVVRKSGDFVGTP